MVFDREDESLRLETRYDNVTSQLVAIVTTYSASIFGTHYIVSDALMQIIAHSKLPGVEPSSHATDIEILRQLTDPALSWELWLRNTCGTCPMSYKEVHAEMVHSKPQP